MVDLGEINAYQGFAGVRLRSGQAEAFGERPGGLRRDLEALG
jgi:hypothetical protein